MCVADVVPPQPQVYYSPSENELRHECARCSAPDKTRCSRSKFVRNLFEASMMMEFKSHNKKQKYLVNFVARILMVQQQQQIITTMVPTQIYNHKKRNLSGNPGIMYTMAEIGEFVDESGNFEGEYMAYIVDAAGTIIGSALGVTTTATFVESSAGMREGGRTGLTAVIIGLFFFLSLFFTPILSSVPPWAIGPSLVMVGVMMMKVVKDIDWTNIKEAVPAFAIMLLMPLTYSIANGIVAGIGLYVALSLFDYAASIINWLGKMRRILIKEHNQVSATATCVDSIVEII